MAGKRGRSGRRPKPRVLHIAEGTHRDDRHGAVGDSFDAEGAPEKPEFSNPWAAQLWEQEVSDLINRGIAKKLDRAMLQSMCELWGLYRHSLSIAEDNPIDKDARIAVATYWAKFEQAAARFGMNASDRSRLKIEKPKTPLIQQRKRG